MKRSVAILLLVGWLGLIVTYWVARSEVPLLVQSELEKERRHSPFFADVPQLNYKKVDAGFSFFINGSFQLHDVFVQLKQFPKIVLFAPSVEVTGFKHGTATGIQIDKLYIHSIKKNTGSGWFLTVRYYQDEQQQKKNLIVNVYASSQSLSQSLAELKVSLSVQSSLIVALHEWQQRKSVEGLKIEYHDYGLQQQLTQLARLGPNNDMMRVFGHLA